jgi:hypothetical protein
MESIKYEGFHFVAHYLPHLIWLIVLIFLFLIKYNNKFEFSLSISAQSGFPLLIRFIGLIMNDADSRRQMPGLQINNPGGMIL